MLAPRIVSYNAALYALIHRGTPGDRPFYARACEGASNLLELGCGYGRLLSTLTASSTSYRGLDIDRALLKLARAERNVLPTSVQTKIALTHGDMRTFSFRERFDRILIPHSTLFCLQTNRDVLRCLRRVHEHLSPKGELLLDCYSADAFHDTLSPESMRGNERDLLTQVEHKGRVYQVFERTRWQRKAQRLSVQYDYEPERGRVQTGSIVHRYLLRDQLVTLLERADLKVLKVQGSFAGARFTKRSEQLIVRARRKS